MLRRSLSNFMNAFTSSDHTSYPFATTNRQDFKNLLSVYLDATLHPLLKENDFLQEGWRIGPENPQARNSDEKAESTDSALVFKGVVYNEMKGQMSDASYLYYTRFQDHICPAINNSGGDPQKMTDLTYDKLREFHASHYHPSNAKLFTYGNIPVADHAKCIDRHLSTFNNTSVDASIKSPISLEEGPIFCTVKGPIDSMLDPLMQYKTSTSWVLGDTSNVLETFSLNIISSLLLGGYGSPLYQALIEGGLGPDFTPNTGFDGSSKVGIFSVGLNGVRQEDVSKVKAVLQDKLREVHNNGFNLEKVEGILHQLELSLKHKAADFGMSLMQRLEPGWFNGIDPFDAIAWNDTVHAFKRKLSEGGYLESLVEKYLLNDNTLTFTMEPSEDFAARLVQEENARLASKISAVVKNSSNSADATKLLERQELQLLEEQAKAPDEDLSSLPTLHVSDISRSMDRKQIRDIAKGPVQVQWRETSTNGLTYLRAIHRFDDLPTDLRMLLPLFTSAVMRLGNKNKSMEQLEDMIKLKTGGISIGYHTSPAPTDKFSSTEGLSFSGYAIDNNIPDMLELLRTVLLETNFDGPQAESKVRQLLQSDASGALDNIAGSGHSYARLYAEAGLSMNGLHNEQIGGLTQAQHVLDLSSRAESEGLGDVIEKLRTIQNLAISNSSCFRVAITCGQEATTSNERALQQFLAGLPNVTKIPEVDYPPRTYKYNPRTFFALPYQVSYTAAVLPTVSYMHPDGAPLQILSQLLTHKHLHHEIREKGAPMAAVRMLEA
ncbi:uncharacterized protein KY384_001910 [Bacidia gigantensis]|uniref:uncharacterized protein n=1 Tax=Bacidia gigantensis TaxID=2732470 RepID=UPI001D059523|nr:uncharacterized protein KY384_001910 [Bacidia gigantensis]KAG8533127.1 hypothetical protein KY384_001910 [Bacidia gigantensis]